MPKNPVTDPITDQEIAYARLILSGTMTDRRAAEAAGLNPSTAAYTKSKPHVRDYMAEHRAAVSEKLVQAEADMSRRAEEGLRALNLGRDQVLARLWQLASLDPEATRGSIAGQIKALSMIVAIEGLIPDRRLSPATPAHAQPAGPPPKAQIYVSEWMRQQRQHEGDHPADAVPAVNPQPAAPLVSDPAPSGKANDAPPPNSERNHSGIANPFVHPAPLSRLPDAIGFAYDAVINPAGDLRLPFTPQRSFFKNGRFTR